MMSSTPQWRWLYAGSLVAIASALTACGSSTSHPKPALGATGKALHLDTARVALAIKASIKSEKGLSATVSCPPNIPQRKGFAFTCTATTYARFHGKRVPVKTPFTVTQTNDLGNVYYASPR